MPVYKDEKTNTWYSKFYYSTWDGVKKQTTKRGFKTKKQHSNGRMRLRQPTLRI